jgi:hypothetical protein
MAEVAFFAGGKLTEIVAAVETENTMERIVADKRLRLYVHYGVTQTRRHASPATDDDQRG